MADRPIRMRRFRAMLSVGFGPFEAAIIASLNYLFYGAATGQTCVVQFMHITLEIDDRNPTNG